MLSLSDFGPRRVLLQPGPHVGCDADCRVHEVDVWCTRERPTKHVSDAGLLWALFAGIAASNTAAGFAIARGWTGITFAIAGAVVLLATIVILWQCKTQRLTACLQIAALYTVTGVAALAGAVNGSTTVYVGIGISVVGVSGLAVAAFTSSGVGVGGAVRLGAISLAACCLVLAIVLASMGQPSAPIVAISAGALVLGFVSGFLPQATATAFGRPLGLIRSILGDDAWEIRRPLKVPVTPRGSTGILAIFDAIARRVATGLNTMLAAVRTVSNTVLAATFKALRTIELTIKRVLIRLGYVVAETYREIRHWASKTWEALDDVLLPNSLGALAIGLAALASLGLADLASDYAGSGEGFSGAGWMDAVQLLAFWTAIGVFIALGWASYTDSDPDGMRLGVRSAYRSLGLFAIGSGAIAGVAIILGVVGLPILEVLPIIEGFSTRGPYSAGPITVLVIVAFVLVFVYVFSRIATTARSGEPAVSTDEENDNDDDKETEDGWGAWLKNAAAIARDLEPGRFGPAIAAVVTVSAVGVLVPATLFFDSANTAQSAASPEGTYVVALEEGGRCDLSVSKSGSGYTASTDCSGADDTCYTQWNGQTLELTLACQRGSRFELEKDGRRLVGTVAIFGGQQAVVAERR